MAVTSIMLFVLIPTLLIMVSALCFVIFSAIWLYQDAKEHGQSPVLWVLICIFATPIIALILYCAFGRKGSVVPCSVCQTPISADSKYCPQCGTPVPSHPIPDTKKKMSGMLKAVIACGCVFVVSIVLLVGSMVAVIASNTPSGSGQAIQTSQVSALPIRSSAFSVNSGWAIIRRSSYHDGVWNYYLSESSEGFHGDSVFELDDPQTRTLMVSTSCEGGPFTLTAKQGDIVQTVDLTDGDGTAIPVDLSDFAPGTVDLRLTNDGATDVHANVWVE